MRQRLAWMERLIERESDGAGLHLSAQAAALFREMRRCFAAGAWLAALILAEAVLEMERGQGALDGPALNAMRYGPDHVWLRNRRNALLHGELHDGAPGEDMAGEDMAGEDMPGEDMKEAGIYGIGIYGENVRPAVTLADMEKGAAGLESDARRALELVVRALC